jgi:gamma-glutamyltranspeptidase / glutathione hydrolase
MHNDPSPGMTIIHPNGPFDPAGNERVERSDMRGADRPSGASFASRSFALGGSGAAACLGFLEPTGSGLGGDCYALLWDPKLAKLVALAGSGRSPRALSLETVRARSTPGGRA